MKTRYLLSSRFKAIGLMLLIPGILLGVVNIFFVSEPEFLDASVFAVMYNGNLGSDIDWVGIIENNIFDEIISVLIIVGGLLTAFSKEKKEDEFISRIRLESLVWAVYLNYAVLLLSVIFIYDIEFFWVLVFNMFTILIFFVIRFNWALYKFKNQVIHEE